VISILLYSVNLILNSLTISMNFQISFGFISIFISTHLTEYYLSLMIIIINTFYEAFILLLNISMLSIYIDAQ